MKITIRIPHVPTAPLAELAEFLAPTIVTGISQMSVDPAVCDHSRLDHVLDAGQLPVSRG